MTVADLTVAALATWQAVEVWHHGSLFAGWRAWVEAKDGWLAELTLCPFCFSVWTAAAVLLALWPDRPEGALDTSAGVALGVVLWTAARLFVYALAVSRLANVANDLTHARCRTPRPGDGLNLEDPDDGTRGPDHGPPAGAA
jgi:hypothetical protein